MMLAANVQNVRTVDVIATSFGELGPADKKMQIPDHNSAECRTRSGCVAKYS
jgi:hypothetical protein